MRRLFLIVLCLGFITVDSAEAGFRNRGCRRRPVINFFRALRQRPRRRTPQVVSVAPALVVTPEVVIEMPPVPQEAFQTPDILLTPVTPTSATKDDVGPLPPQAPQAPEVPIKEEPPTPFTIVPRPPILEDEDGEDDSDGLRA
jgi:hypothetical protein